MTGLAKKPRFWIIVTALILVLLIILFPLRFAINMFNNDRMLSARQVPGTIWSGRLVDARIGGIPVGTVDSHLQFWPLLRGHKQLFFNRDATPNLPALHAAIGTGEGYFSVNDARGSIPISTILSGVPLKSLEFQNFNAEFVGQKCVSAGGQVRAIPDAIIPGLNLQAGFLGKASCEDNDLVLRLASGSGMEKLEFRVKGSGHYTATILLIGDQAGLLPTLTSAGFLTVSVGYKLSHSGVLVTTDTKIN